MSVLFIVVPVTLLLVGAAVFAYSWAASRGQFDDTTTPALRMLDEDDGASPAPKPMLEAPPKLPRAGSSATPGGRSL